MKINLKPVNHYPFQTTTDSLTPAFHLCWHKLMKILLPLRELINLSLAVMPIFMPKLLNTLKVTPKIILDDQLVHRGLFELSKTLQKKEIIQ